MDFRVYVIVEMPILDKKYELLVPIDRRIHDLISVLKKAIPELSDDYYERREPVIMSKTSGDVYDLNVVIKNTNIKNGTRLILI
jgi:hypothetical protein